VSREAGAPYRDKLLRLPGFLLSGDASPAPDGISDGLALTGFFLARHIFEPLDHKCRRRVCGLLTGWGRDYNIWEQISIGPRLAVLEVHG